MWLLVLVSIVASCVLSLTLTPIIRWFCLRFGIIDKPDAVRKLQLKPVSLGGGMAIFVSVCLAFTIVLLGDRYLGNGVLGTLDIRWHILFYAAAALMLVGLADDAFTLRGRQKLLLQLLVVVAVVGGGTVVQSLQFVGFRLDLGVFAYPLTVVWLLAAINALNLIDGADGMASTAGAIISLGLAILCVQMDAFIGSVVAAALCGALVGFLYFNRPPASIYLGDAGSMVIGLFVGVISIWGSVKGTTLLSFAPMLILSLPLFDSSIAILRRVLTGRSIYATDRAHLHHRLLDRFSHPMMLVVVACLCGITSAASIISVLFNQQWIAVLGVGIVFAALVVTRIFGNAELHMLVRRTANFGESLLVRSHHCDLQVHQKTVQLQGNRHWDQIWQSLVEFAIDRELSKIRLDVSIAWMQEGYHGSWQRSRLPEKSEQLCLKLPIFLDNRLVGRLELVGDAKKTSVIGAVEQIHDRFVELKSQIRRLIETVELEVVNDDEAALVSSTRTVAIEDSKAPGIAVGLEFTSANSQNDSNVSEASQPAFNG